MLTYENLTLENLSKAIRIQAAIFPHENDEDILRCSCTRDGKEIQGLFNYSEFWLVKNGENYIGLTGLYAYSKYPKDAWLNWFGILPEYRCHGFGHQVLRWTMDQAKEKGYEQLHLYTEIGDNDDAISFYRHLKFPEERYTAEKNVKNLIIFNTSTAPEKQTILWNNKNLFLYEQILNYDNNPWRFIKKTPFSFIGLFFKRPTVFFKTLKRLLT